MNKELLKKNIKKPRKQRATKSNIKTKYKIKNKQNQIKQKVIINLGDVLKKQTRRRNTSRRNKNDVGYRPNSVPSVDIVRYDVSPLQAQLIQQAETIRAIREKNDEKPNETALVLHIKEQQNQYKNDQNELIKQMKSNEKHYQKALLKNDDIGTLHNKLITYHKSIQPQPREKINLKYIEIPNLESNPLSGNPLGTKKKPGRPKNPNTVPKQPPTMTRVEAAANARQKKAEKKEAIKTAVNAPKHDPHIMEEVVNQYYDALNE